ncbi:hypothetical protein [Alloprevotella rava]|uniref:hypothetical protein n=1 Tax=Alloprevotella rava TaxID=671218 RepID=UPI0003133A98|nr:hypothetical protein [Alloprevotella rava]
MTSEVIITRPVWEEYRRIKPRLRNQALAALIDYLMTGEKPAFSRNINTPFNQLLVTYKESTESLHSSRTHLALISHSSQEEEKQKKASSPCTPILKEEEEKEEERLILPTSELAARDTAETAIEVVEGQVGPIGQVGQVGPVRDPNKRLPSTPRLGKTGGSFNPPTLDEVCRHVAAKGYSFDPVAFFSHYESNGWLVGRTKMKNWHSACITWERNQKTYGNYRQSTSATRRDADLQAGRETALDAIRQIANSPY